MAVGWPPSRLGMGRVWDERTSSVSQFLSLRSSDGGVQAS
jgi:hypothetical protein